MKRFAKLLLAAVGFGMLGFVMSLIPQKSAGGTPPPPPGAPVSIVSSVPLTVGVNNTPSQPVPTLGAEALSSFVAYNSCAAAGTSLACQIAPIYTVPQGQIAVIESVAGFCGGTAPFAIIFLEMDFTGPDGQPKGLRFAPGPVVPNGGGDVTAWGLNLKTYASSGDINFLAEGSVGSTGGSCNAVISGYLVPAQ